MHLTAQEGKIELCELLLKHGVSPHHSSLQTSSDIPSPLFLAAQAGHKVFLFSLFSFSFSFLFSLLFLLFFSLSPFSFLQSHFSFLGNNSFAFGRFSKRFYP